MNDQVQVEDELEYKNEQVCSFEEIDLDNLFADIEMDCEIRVAAVRT